LSVRNKKTPQVMSLKTLSKITIVFCCGFSVSVFLATCIKNDATNSVWVVKLRVRNSSRL